MKGTLLFLRQTANHWRTTGAFAPSGPALARAIADQVGPVADGQVIVELGPGTGVITRELLRRFPQCRVVAVEVLEAFAPLLAEACPGATVVTGCASQLNAHLEKLGIAPDNVAAVVSGLPLLVLPEDLGRRIVEAAAAVLRPGRRYVQFTYSGRRWRRRTLPGFRRVGSRRVWLNVPPAVVLTFEREG